VAVDHFKAMSQHLYGEIRENLETFSQHRRHLDREVNAGKKVKGKVAPVLLLN